MICQLVFATAESVDNSAFSAVAKPCRPSPPASTQCQDDTMKKYIVTDAELGQLAVKQHELFRRVKEGSVGPIKDVLAAVQTIIEGRIWTTDHNAPMVEVPEEKERTRCLADAQVSEQLAQGAEVLKLGKVWTTKELHAFVDELNQKLVKSGEPTWRLPTKAELLTSRKEKDNRFGKWMTWSGDTVNHPDYPNNLWIVTMSEDPSSALAELNDWSGSQVDAYLVKTGHNK